MVALEKIFALHLVQILPISHTFLYCNLPWEIHNDKKIDTSLCIDPFFSCHPRLENDWSVLQESAITRKRRTTYASLEAKLQQQKFSGWWSQIYNGSISLLFHLLNIGQKSYLWKTPDATLCTLKIWDLKAWLEFWVYNNSRSHSLLDVAAEKGNEKSILCMMDVSVPISTRVKSCWGF